MTKDLSECSILLVIYIVKNNWARGYSLILCFRLDFESRFLYGLHDAFDSGDLCSFFSRVRTTTFFKVLYKFCDRC